MAGTGNPAAMSKRILIIDGHPDPDPGRLCHGLAAAYASGAVDNGHEVRRLDLHALDFPLLRRETDFETGDPPPVIANVQEDIRWSEHIVIVYPLWLGTMPALLKGFLEQAIRPDFAFERTKTTWPRKLLKGRTARIVVTMGMPVMVYRWIYLSHSLRNLERNILKFVGIGPVRETLFGMVREADEQTSRRATAGSPEWPQWGVSPLKQAYPASSDTKHHWETALGDTTGRRNRCSLSIRGCDSLCRGKRGRTHECFAPRGKRFAIVCRESGTGNFWMQRWRRPRLSQQQTAK